MPLEIHAHEGEKLDKARVDPAQSAGKAQRHEGDQRALEPLDRAAHGQFIDLGRVDTRIDRPRHEREARRLGRVAVLGHQRGGRQGGDSGLAYGHQVCAPAEGAQEGDQVLHKLVEAESPGQQRDIARVVPVGNVDVMVGQHSLHGPAQQGGEVAGHRGNQQHARLAADAVAAEMQQRAEWRTRHDFLGNLHRQPVDDYAVNTECGPVVGQAGQRQDLASGPERAQ